MNPKKLKVLLVVIAVAYVLFPRDFLPDYFGRGVGFIDDALVVLVLAYIYLRNKRRYVASGDAPAPHSAASPSAAAPPAADPDPRAVLGVSSSATQQEVQKAYRARMAEYHPDRVSHLGEELRKVAHEKTLEIQRAYERLKR